MFIPREKSAHFKSMTFSASPFTLAPKLKYYLYYLKRGLYETATISFLQVVSRGTKKIYFLLEERNEE